MIVRILQPAALLLGLMPLAAGMAFAQTTLYAPERNPFTPPADARHRPAQGEQTQQVQPAEQPSWKPMVRAIIHGGPRSLVNLNGNIVGIGETVSGYRLVEVSDYEAVFVRDGKRITLTVGMQQAS